MLSSKHFSIGDLRGVIYDFDKVGDLLPTHIHTEFDVHITIICKGKIKAYSDNWEKEAISGQIMDFHVGEPHEIMALEDNTRIINIIKKLNKTNEIYNSNTNIQ